MTQLKVVNIEGAEVGEIEVSDSIFNTEVKEYLFYEVVKWQLARRRAGTACTKGRSEVSGGGAKPYRQKGTGRARQGSRRAPNHVGGGIVHGPKPRSYAYNINKKLRRAALRCALSKRAQEGRLVVVRDLGMDEIKTKSAASIFNTLAADPSTSKRRSESGHALVLGPRAESDEKLLNLKRSVQNLQRVNYLAVDGLNLYDVLNHRFLIIREPEVNHLQEVLG
ncbi:MAG: 50S ribosomal protein L4 [Myxococcales bacterium]|nr:50S ribosomal protein L4 [Myxococcales bacterium]